MPGLKSIFKLLGIAIASVYYTVKALLLYPFTGIKIFYKESQNWAKATMWICGIKVRIEGNPQLSRSQSYLIIANHTSLFDIPIVLSSISLDFGIIYKKELEKIPIFGYGLKLSPFIGIIRENPRKSLESLDIAVERIRAGESVLVFPEGTRSKTSEMQSFKRGGFLIAEKSKVDIQPLTIVGAHDILGDNYEIKPKEVILRYAEIIKGENVNRSTMEEVERIIKSQLD
jgi:1-acyl-sn-glycerol-3-phosphate acyltransferase